MASYRVSVALAAAALLSAGAGAAHAADKPEKRLDFTVRTEPTTSAPHSGLTTKWDASKGRWGVTLNLQQPNARPSTLNDVAAGAYYSITPSLKVGGSVALGDGANPLRYTTPTRVPTEQPKVRLETRFKF